jgi:NAD(P)H-flavin reductase
MLEALAGSGHREQVLLYFGCRTRRDNILDPFLNGLRGRLALSEVLCLSRENGEGNNFHGRVTDALAGLGDGLPAMEFYVAGNPNMTGEVTRMLQRRGATAVFTENY